jgi:hypothetical protein
MTNDQESMINDQETMTKDQEIMINDLRRQVPVGVSKDRWMGRVGG